MAGSETRKVVDAVGVAGGGFHQAGFFAGERDRGVVHHGALGIQDHALNTGAVLRVNAEGKCETDENDQKRAQQESSRSHTPPLSQEIGKHYPQMEKANSNNTPSKSVH